MGPNIGDTMRQTIKKALENINKGAQFDYLIENVQFFPISSLMAMDHKNGDGKNASKNIAEAQTST